jgi:general secretion pathway protein H
MPISATGSNDRGSTPLRRSAENGFTLVELMVVIAIIAVTTAIVTFAIPDPRGRVIADAEAFAARTLAARDDAILQSRDMRIWVTPVGYGVDRRRQGRWVPMTDKPFKPANWSSGTGAIVGEAGRAQIMFDATGAAASPMTVTLVRDSERATVTVAGSGAIRVGS